MTKTPRKLWLAEYTKESTKYRYERDFNLFCEWAKTSDVELVEEYQKATNKKQWAKEKGAQIVRWYTHLVSEKGLATNTARAMLSGIRAFLTSQCEQPKIKKGAIPRPKIALGEHEFTQAELKRMFHYADVREKAILATAISLGWGAKDFLALKWSFIEPYLEKEAFTGFFYERTKTGAISRSHLTPEAIESLKAWREAQKRKGKKTDYVWANGNGRNHITGDALNDIVRKMVEEAGIETTGKVHFHLIRKFLFSALSNAGLNTMQCKLMVGKSVPPDVLTYLIRQKEQLSQKFQEAYPLFSLVGFTNQNHDRLETLEAQVKRLEEENETLKAFIRNFATIFGIDATERIKKLLETGKLDKTKYERMLAMLNAKPKNES